MKLGAGRWPIPAVYRWVLAYYAHAGCVLLGAGLQPMSGLCVARCWPTTPMPAVCRWAEKKANWDEHFSVSADMKCSDIQRQQLVKFASVSTEIPRTFIFTIFKYKISSSCAHLMFLRIS
ncbi:hypothetical protein HAX54_026077 [Datura stramonium]|uniref:Secreted protein n=1 Tax=Datura stramonium TaxID=4076 RepID=A0ABS8S798_DATST|nr:hypothetical protein [Datura stramonium]